MKQTLIQNAKIYTTLETIPQGWILLEDGKIKKYGEGTMDVKCIAPCNEVIDAQGNHLLPGFIDIHTHGCLGDCTMDADGDKIIKMSAYQASHGVTGFLPTTMTDSPERIRAAISAVRDVMTHPMPGAKVLGVHLEGPFISEVKAGAQDPAQIRRAMHEEYNQYINTGIIKLITMAPEFEENLRAGEVFAANGIAVSAGHSDASYEALEQAALHGYTNITHLFNGMGWFNHFNPGTIGGALTIDAYSCEMICDNVHSHRAAQKLAWRAKGNKKLILITDTIRPAGLPDGTYTNDAGEPEFIVSCCGTNLRLPSGTLAGSALTMNRALKHLTENAESTIDETWRCSSLNAALSIGVSAQTGSIEIGKAADLVLLDDDFTVLRTWVDGMTVFRKE